MDWRKVLKKTKEELITIIISVNVSLGIHLEMNIKILLGGLED